MHELIVSMSVVVPPLPPPLVVIVTVRVAVVESAAGLHTLIRLLV